MYTIYNFFVSFLTMGALAAANYAYKPHTSFVEAGNLGSSPSAESNVNETASRSEHPLPHSSPELSAPYADLRASPPSPDGTPKIFAGA